MRMNITMLIALGGQIFWLATTAQAVSITVLNQSFEHLNPRTVQNIPNLTRGVDIFDAVDGVLDGDLFHTTSGVPIDQPTANDNPRDWTTSEDDSHAIAWDARWPGWHHATNAGPAHGHQSLLLDNRGNGINGQIKQSLGTVGSLGIGGLDKLVMTFNARFGEPGQTPSGDPNVDFYAFFEVNAAEIIPGRFHSSMGQFSPERIIQTWGELGLNNTTDHLPPNLRVANPPGPQIALGTLITSQTQHMGEYSVELPLTGLSAGDSIGIGIRYEDNGTDGGCCNARTYVDNVRVDAISVIPEPTSMATAMIGLMLLCGVSRCPRRRK